MAEFCGSIIDLGQFLMFKYFNLLKSFPQLNFIIH
jgi:hypothetical protein